MIKCPTSTSVSKRDLKSSRSWVDQILHPSTLCSAVFGNPAHLLDAANYVQCAWDAVTSTIISNAWRKQK